MFYAFINDFSVALKTLKFSELITGNSFGDSCIHVHVRALIQWFFNG